MNAVEKQECIPVGCVPSAVVAVLGWGVCLGRRCLPLGDSASEVSTWGCLPGGVLHLDPEADTSTLWTEFLTHACENITFLQLLLRTVINVNLPHGVVKTYIEPQCMEGSQVESTH